MNVKDQVKSKLKNRNVGLKEIRTLEKYEIEKVIKQENRKV